MKTVIAGGLFFGIPILFEVWMLWKKDMKAGQKIFRYISACVASNSIVGLVYLHYGLSWTTYEYLLLEAVLSIVTAMLIIPIAAKEKVRSKQVLHMSCLLVTAAALYSVLSYGQTAIHSDTATAVMLARSQIRHKSIFPSSWCYVNGDLWVLALNIFVMPFSVVLHNQSLARVLGSALLIIITLGAMYYQSRRAFRDDSWMLSIPLFLVFLHGHGVKQWEGSVDMILYQAAYTGQMLSIALMFTWLYLIWSEKMIMQKMALFIVMMALACMGGIRAIAEISLPLGCACLLFLYMQNKEKERLKECCGAVKQAAFLSAVIWIPSLIGYGINKWICASRTVLDTENNALLYAGSFRDCWSNFTAVIVDMFDNFGFAGDVQLISLHGIGNMVSFFACIVVVFIVPVLQARRLKEESRATVCFFIFGMVHNVIILMMAVLFGKTKSRYLLSSVYVFIIISAHYMMTHWWKPKTLQKKLRIMSFIAAAAVQCMVLLHHSSGWAEALREKKEFVHELTDRGLCKGYASYWNAYSNVVYSDLQLRMGGVQISEDGIWPYRWLVDLDVYQAEETDTFLMLNQEEYEMLGKNVSELYGDPVQKFTVHDMYIYVFDYDIMDRENK